METTKVNKLRQAMQAEKLAIAASEVLYHNLTQKISHFQMGKGSAPTEAEFTQWVAEVEKAIDLKRVLNGITGATDDA